MLHSRDGTGKYPIGQWELCQEYKMVQISKQNPLIIVMEISV